MRRKLLHSFFFLNKPPHILWLFTEHRRAWNWNARWAEAARASDRPRGLQGHGDLGHRPKGV